MRSDMNKIVTERRRSHSNETSKKTGGKIHQDKIEDDDHGATRLKSSKRWQYGWNARSSDVMMGPIRSFFRRNVGQPWDKVYSELCERFDARSKVGNKVRDYLRYEVYTKVVIKNGIPWDAEHRFGTCQQIHGFYVHPVTALLCEASGRKRYRPAKKEATEIPLTDLTELVKEKGIWYLNVYEMQPDSYHHWDVATKTYVSKRRPKDKKVLVKKEQLNSKELRKYSLENTPEETTITRKDRAAINRKD